MTLEYDFVREQGRWKLASARTLTSEYLEPQGWKPQAGHGGGGDGGRGAQCGSWSLRILHLWARA